ncbi:hypothetical protein FXO38_20761 [Capsicum annuum]|nr:hypothetical protein FXO38_20761 [Capsicum annuum]
MHLTKDFSMNSFPPSQDFKRYKVLYVDEILCLMRGTQFAYLDAYNVGNRIMDLNFNSNFKNKYDDLSALASTPSGPGFNLLVSTFKWDQDMTYYVRGKRIYTHDKDYIREKRILTVMNLDVKHFVVLEILL